MVLYLEPKTSRISIHCSPDTSWESNKSFPSGFFMRIFQVGCYLCDILGTSYSEYTSFCIVHISSKTIFQHNAFKYIESKEHVCSSSYTQNRILIFFSKSIDIAQEGNIIRCFEFKKQSSKRFGFVSRLVRNIDICL